VYRLYIVKAENYIFIELNAVYDVQYVSPACLPSYHLRMRLINNHLYTKRGETAESAAIYIQYICTVLLFSLPEVIFSLGTE
jgi:hypothetical protein